MLVEFLKSKIAYARITKTELFYEGSITIDEKILKAAKIQSGEKVEVLNINNGNRFNTYVIVGKTGSGEIALNGPAARLGLVGDQIMILSYAHLDPKEVSGFKSKIVQLDHDNKIKS